LSPKPQLSVVYAALGLVKANDRLFEINAEMRHTMKPAG
jgi:hypothetical protein